MTKKNASPISLTTFNGVTIHNLISNGEILQEDYKVLGDTPFRHFKVASRELAWGCKYGLIDVDSVERTLVYVVRDAYSEEIVPMTEEQYHNLPDFFKEMVETEVRTKYQYRFNRQNMRILATILDVLKVMCDEE